MINENDYRSAFALRQFRKTGDICTRFIKREAINTLIFLVDIGNVEVNLIQAGIEEFVCFVFCKQCAV